jgi:hypothetical protein
MPEVRITPRARDDLKNIGRYTLKDTPGALIRAEAGRKLRQGLLDEAMVDFREEQTEDEAAFEDSTQTMIGVPNELVPAIRELFAKHHT